MLSSFSKLTSFKLHVDLVRTKLLDFNSLKWFFLSVIAISTLFTVSTSFLLGFQNQQLFTDNSEANILVISQPQITPAQSQIPLFWIDDIQQLPGIQTVSPETVDLVIDQTNGQTPYFRGITDNFKNLANNFSMIAGIYFETDQSNTSNQVIVGQNYANLFHIVVGENLVLQSRSRTVNMDVKVTGIFASNSIADDGVLGPLWMGRLFGGLSDNIVNIIRIKFDPQQYTKSELQHIILDTHTIKVLVTNPYNYNVTISQSTIELYNRYKEKINQSFLNIYNEAYFSAPFGKYFVKLINPDVSISKFIAIFVKGYTTSNLTVGTQYEPFTAQFSISNDPKTNALITIVNQETQEQFNFTTDSNGSISGDLPLGTLQIKFYWRSYTNSTVINHQTAENRKINFDYGITLAIRESKSNTVLSNKLISIKNLESNQLITTYSDNQGFINTKLQPDTPYRIESNNSNLNRIVDVNYFNDTQFIVYLGKIDIRITVKDIDSGNIANQPINISFYNPVKASTNHTTVLTNSQGHVQVVGESGWVLTLQSIYGLSNETFSKSYVLENSPELVFYLGKQELGIGINNTLDNKDIYPSNVVLTNLVTSETTTLVINSHDKAKIFLEFANYSISATTPKYSFYDEINFNSSNFKTYYIDYSQYLVDLTFYTKNSSVFSGHFNVLQKRNANFNYFLQDQYTSKITLTLQNGLYRIQLVDVNYLFDTTIKVNSQNIKQQLTVTEKTPQLTYSNFANYSIVNSSQILQVAFAHAKTVLYHWDGEQNQQYNSNLGIKTPLQEGAYILSITSINYDSNTILLKYIIHVDNTGPIAYLHNENGNNSWIDYNLVPIFSFSETPKSVHYTWNSTGTTTLNPTALPSSNGPQKLTVEVEDFAQNINYFYYVFTFDNETPQLSNANVLNNSIIYSQTINLVFSENLLALYYSWNGEFFTISSSQIPVTIADSLNDNLSLRFYDLAGNYNQVNLTFSVIDIQKPSFTLFNIANNSIFKQLLDARVPFITANTNQTVFYKWNNASNWTVLYTSVDYNYSISVPNSTGILLLQVKIFDEFNNNDSVIKNYTFIGDFTSPQFNVSINESIGPNMPVSIIFPSNYKNWTMYWDTVLNSTGNMSSTVIFTPVSFGYHTLNISYYDTSLMTMAQTIFNVSIENAIPRLSNENVTYLSSHGLYTLVFPSYVSTWNYSWPSSAVLSGSNISTNLFIPNSLSGLQNLTVNYRTIYNKNSSFVLQYTLDSQIPYVKLLDVANQSTQKGGFLPRVQFSESLKQKLFSWNNGANTTFIKIMPVKPENAYSNLTIYMQDYAGNWNKTVYSFKEDNTPIVLTLNPSNSSINSEYVKTGDIILFNTSENASSITCNWGSVTPTNCLLEVPVIYFQGIIKFTIRVYDKAGNGASLILLLRADYTPPVITYSSLQNNSVINSYFTYSYSFSETVLAGNSYYSWDTFPSDNGFPTINTSLTGPHTLTWLFSDNQGNWNKYIFNVFVYTKSPTYTLQGNYSSTVITANSSLFIIPIDQSSPNLDIFYSWNSQNFNYIQAVSNSKITIPLPDSIGNQSFSINIRDSNNNWNNQTIPFVIKPFFSIELTTSQNIPVSNISLELKNSQNNTVVAFTNTTNKISLFLNQANYSLTINFGQYNLTSSIHIGSSSLTKKFTIIPVIIKFTNSNNGLISNLTGLLEWNNDFFTSTPLNINGTKEILISQAETTFNAIINNNHFERTIDVFQNNLLVNFTTQPKLLTLKIYSEQNKLPVENAAIKIDQKITGLSDIGGIFSKLFNPGSYNLLISFKSFQQAITIDIFENQTQIIYLPITTTINVVLLNSDNSPAEYIPVSLSSDTEKLVLYGISDFNGQITWNNIPWGSYTLAISFSNSTIDSNITISSLSDSQNNIFTINLPTNNKLDAILGNNLGKWTFNRNYEISDPGSLSDQTLQNLGFSVVFSTLFLIILSMSLLGLISILHNPIYKLRHPIRDLRRIGASKKQILAISSVQFTFMSMILSLLGFCLGLLLLTFWPSLQQYPIAGMIIRPQIYNLDMILIQTLSFGLITFVYSWYYTNKEYFHKKKNTLVFSSS